MFEVYYIYYYKYYDMKKNWLFLLSLVSMACYAQSFEGTVTWSMKYEITDPAKKAEMEKSQKTMNDPANQEKMKKMQEQMNSPEMKAMMESNPQMKARMESAMKMMQGGDMGSMMSKGFTIETKDNNSLTKMNGGMMSMDLLYLREKNQGYMLDRTAKTYRVMSSSGNPGQKRDSVKHTVTKTTETMKILNYTCTKYIVTMTTEKGSTINQVFWTTTEIKGLDMKSLSRQRMGNSGQSMYLEGIDGVPLRIEMGTEQMNMIMEVTEIKKETLPASDFVIPADFKETKGYGG